MRICSPQLHFEDGSAKLRAKVDIGRNAQRFPEELWFSVPERFAHLFSERSESFVVALSSLASSLNETIVVEGTFSERLSLGLDEYWNVLSTWFPTQFNPLRMSCDHLVQDETRTGRVAAAAFSGGVDSFFTQFQNRNRSANFQTKYAVFIHGFDIPLSQIDVYEAAAEAYEKALAQFGVELVRVTTNARLFVPPKNWEVGHGSLLCGTGLALRAGISRFFVPSSKSYTTLAPWGSDPLIDGLLSTDDLQVIHDGAAYSRFDKLSLMKDWQPLRHLLRTCYHRPDAFQNCGRCQNCRRTMMVLASLGVLDEFRTFPPIHNPLHYVNTEWETSHERLFGTQAIAQCAERGESGIAWAGKVAMQTSRFKHSFKTAKAASRPLRHRLSNGLSSFFDRTHVYPKSPNAPHRT